MLYFPTVTKSVVEIKCPELSVPLHLHFSLGYVLSAVRPDISGSDEDRFLVLQARDAVH